MVLLHNKVFQGLYANFCVQASMGQIRAFVAKLMILRYLSLLWTQSYEVWFRLYSDFWTTNWMFKPLVAIGQDGAVGDCLYRGVPAEKDGRLWHAVLRCSFLESGAISVIAWRTIAITQHLHEYCTLSDWQVHSKMFWALPSETLVALHFVTGDSVEYAVLCNNRQAWHADIVIRNLLHHCWCPAQRWKP